jgi:hypothetical protein
MAPPLGAIERRQAVAELRGAFMAYTWSLRDRRRRFDTDISEELRDEIRAEYRELRRRLDRAYRPVRDLFVEFLGEEPRYDLRHEVYEDGGSDLPVDHSFTQWWDALTFDEAFDKWRTPMTTTSETFSSARRLSWTLSRTGPVRSALSRTRNHRASCRQPRLICRGRAGWHAS